MLKRFAFLVLLGLMHLPVYGQSILETNSFWDKFSIRNYGVEEGLYSKQVYKIHQSEEGYFWIASNRQLLRFDGISVKDIKLGNQGGTLYDMVEGSNRDIWIPSFGQGLYLFNGDSLISKKEITGDLTKSVLPLDNDSLLIGTFGEGLKVFYTDSVYSTYTKEDGLIGNEIWTLEKDHNDHIWIGTNDGLSIFDGKSFTNFDTNNGLPHSEIRTIKALTNGEVWVGTDKEGIVIFNNKKPVKYLNETNGLTSKLIYSIAELDDGRILIGTLGSGLFIFENGNIVENLTLEKGLISNNINTIYPDKNGNILIGTEDGLSVLVPKIFTSLSLDNKSIFRDEVVSLNMDGNGSIWMGTYGKGYRYFKDGKWNSTENPPKKTNGYAQSGTVDNQGNLWVGTQGSGVFQVIGNDLELRYTTENGLFDNYVRGLAFDDNNNLWVGSNKGISVFDSSGQLTQTYSTEKEIPNPFCTTMLMASDGSIWYGSYGGGVVRFKNNEKTIFNEQKGLKSDQVLSLFEDSNNEIWIGTFNYGLSKVVGDSLFTLSNEDGFPNMNYAGFLEDEKKNLWIASGNGILKVNLTDIQGYQDGTLKAIPFRYFNNEDGILSDNFQAANNSTTLKTSDGTLLFASIDGVSLINPRVKEINESVFKTYIDELVVDGKKIFTLSDVVLSPENKKMEISFSAVNLSAPKKTQFRIKLVGIDDDWNYVENRTTAYYDYLPDGDYTFHVSAIGPDGQWSKKTTSLDFTVLPPFYKTWWFIGLCLFGFVGLGAGGVQIRSNMKLQALNRELETKQKIQAERERISRELHDNVGSQISNLITGIEISNLHVKKNQQNEALSLLNNLDNDARGAMTDLRETIWLLDKENVEFGIFLDHLNGYLKRQKRYLKQLEVSVESSIDSQFILDPIQSLNLTRIIQEALNNTNKYAEANSFTISCTQQKQAITIRIIDNGIGMDTTSELGTGNGLINMKERAKLMGASILIESKMNKGTSIELQFPEKKTK